MKIKHLFIAFTLLCSVQLSSQTIPIPDANFEQSLIDLGWDTNGLNGTILESDVIVIDSLDIQDPLNNTKLPNVTAKIKSLSGIEAMVNLVSLEAGLNEITTVDLSKNTALTNLFLNDNGLTSIDVSKNLALKRFGVMRNQITSVDVSMLVNLVDLFVHENEIATLDVTNNKALEWLYTINNKLTSINLSNNTKLKRIDIYGNALTAIDVSMLVDLEDLRIANNQLTYVDVSKNSKLFAFSANNNQLEVLNVKNGNNVNFTYFDATNNPDLTCIQVDDVAFSTANWPNKDLDASYHVDCAIAATVYIPDYYMKTALVADLTINTNGDTEIQVTEAEALTETLTLEALNIDNLTGIAAFKNITGLRVRNNNLTTVDLANNTQLTFLSIDTNQLTDLDLTALTSLETLYAGSNQLTAIDVTHNLALTKLWVNTNNLSALDISKNTHLEELELDWNYNLSAIDFSNNLKLNRIHLWKTGITTIDVTHLVDLERLYVSETNLAAIDISKNLKLYDFRSTDNPQISTYDFSNNTALTRIDISNGNVNALDISKNTKLTQLLLGQNNLTAIDISKNTLLEELYVNHNKLVQLDVSAHSNLTVLSCNDNLLTALNVNNGNNSNFTNFNTANNVDLTCVQVDDVAFANTNFTNKDAQTFFSTDCNSPFVEISDTNFEQSLIDLGWDTNGLNGTLLESDAIAIDSLDIQDPLNNTKLPNVTAKIKSLSGIEAMVNLVSLEAGLNEITTVDLSKNTALTNLFLNDNGLTSIDVSKNLALKRFGVMRNQITSVDVSMLVNLVDLFVHENEIATLDVSNNKALEWLYTINNKLTSINLSNNTKLKRIDIYGNALTAIDVSMLVDLEDLRIANNQLTRLDISKNSKLFAFSANDNQLEVLNVKNGNNANFTYFDATNNPDLTCIQVDDVAFSTTNWPNKDLDASYNVNCNSVWEVYTQDANLVSSLFTITGLDADGDGLITYEEAQTFTGTLNLSGQNISDITGLEAFANVTGLNISGNNITDINNLLLGNTVTVSNKVSGEKRTMARNFTSIESLDVSNNLITEIDITAITTLKELNVSNNNLTSVNLKNGANAQLSTFNATGNPQLKCIQVDDVITANLNANWLKDATATYSVDCSSALHVNENLLTKVSLYPNPAKTKVQISLADGVVLNSIEIYTLVGKKITAAKSNTIQVKDLSKGIYLVKINTNKGTVNTKLIKE